MFVVFPEHMCISEKGGHLRRINSPSFFRMPDCYSYICMHVTNICRAFSSFSVRLQRGDPAMVRPSTVYKGSWVSRNRQFWRTALRHRRVLQYELRDTRLR